MTHSSGISVTNELTAAFAEARSGSVRFIKVEIINEELVPTESVAPSGDETADFALLAGHLVENAACYILYRKDVEGALGYEWILMSYVPDTAPVKDKMVYASTRSNLKQQIGDMNFAEEMHGTIPDDFTYDGYLAYKTHEATEAPLTEAEKAINEEKNAELDQGHTRSGVHGVAFPLSKDAQDSVAALAAGSINYVQMSLDVSAETIELVSSCQAEASGIPSMTPADTPRYHLFNYNHVHEGVQTSPVVFIYSCPTNSPIKERMLYSSVKAACTEQIQMIGVLIDKRIEICDPDDLDIDYEIHPPAVEKKAAFARPAGPGGRGGRRLVRRSRKAAE